MLLTNVASSIASSYDLGNRRVLKNLSTNMQFSVRHYTLEMYFHFRMYKVGNGCGCKILHNYFPCEFTHVGKEVNLEHYKMMLSNLGEFVPNTVKPAHEVTSIKQSPVFKFHIVPS